jgi:hypothetical protein
VKDAHAETNTVATTNATMRFIAFSSYYIEAGNFRVPYGLERDSSDEIVVASDFG